MPQPAVDSAFSLIRLALAALRADGQLAVFLRPGQTSLLGSNGTPHPPLCDPATATASSVVPNYAATSFLQTTAIYPPGDTACAQSPEVVLVVRYGVPSASAPQVGLGYLVAYSAAPYPFEFARVGASTAIAPVQLALYVSTSGSSPSTVDFTTAITSVALSAAPSTPPAPGAFPATFPSQFTDQSTNVANALAQYGLAFLSQGDWYASTIGTSPLVAGWFPGIVARGAQVTYGVTDQQSLSVTLPSSPAGATTLSNSSASPEYAISRTSNDPVVPLSPFPLPAGQTAFSVGTTTSVGEFVPSANFSRPVINTVSYLSDGTFVGAHVRYVDAASGVSVDLASKDGVIYVLTATDTIKNVPLTNPSPLLLTFGGNDCPFSYTPFEASPTQPAYLDTIQGFVCATAAAPAARSRSTVTVPRR